ncbi:MAG: OmpA family protein, partial [Flavitalea sp.]
IETQFARPDSVLFHTQKLGAPNSSEKGLFAPVHISDNKFLFSSTQTDSVRINGVNPNHSRIFYATLNNGSLEEMIPVTLTPAEPANNLGAATVSADGNYIYFSQWKKEKGTTVSSIYYSVRQEQGWSSPTLLASVNTIGHNSKQPFCSKDGKYLFFASDRRDGFGKFDIWYAPLQKDGTTGVPVNAGEVINSTGDEQAPFYHNSSTTLVFSSNGRPGMGGYDLFAAKGKESTWRFPENMGHPVNSSRDDIYFFAQERTSLLSNAIFSSDRGDGCCLETYSIAKAPKNMLLTGVLLDCNDNTPIAGADVMLKNASEKTWTATTNTDGKYIFELKSGNHQDLTVTFRKELYRDTASWFTTENIDESDFLTDKVTITGRCIEKHPVIPVDTIAVVKPEDVLPIKAEDVVTVYFEFDRSRLNASAISTLDSIYNVLMENSTSTIQISGYTDGVGTHDYNNKLSDKRARSCASYFVQKGIPTARITFVSFGACCPVEMEIINGRDNSDGRSRNRRALINIKKD